MPSSFEIRDCNGRTLKVGDPVLAGDDAYGMVIEISEPDGDYDDEAGRAVEICPVVVVQFDDHSTDRNSTYNDTQVTWADYPDGPWHSIYVCDDVEKIAEGNS